MNERRYDWLSDRWVIFAPNRDDRPDEYKTQHRQLPSNHVECPFCSGAESETPAPTLVLPENDFDSTVTNRKMDSSKLVRAPWQVRVVPNRFPAIPRYSESLGNEMPLRMHPIDSPQSDGTDRFRSAVAVFSAPAKKASHLFQKHEPRGTHEVIIESPTHVDSITGLSHDHIALILEAYRRRLSHCRSQKDLKYAVVFKNYGADAGASLFHSHSQLISLDFVPRDIERLSQRLALHYTRFGCCYVCQMMAEELEFQERVVYESDHFVAICPFASRFPFSFSIIPKTHRSRYEEIVPAELNDLACVAKATLSALESAHPSAAYNFVLQTSPFCAEAESSEHWRLRVIPRLSKVAGFEWGSDCFINTVTPEEATKTLRAQLRVEDC